MSFFRVMLNSLGDKEVKRGVRVVGSVLIILFLGDLVCRWFEFGRFLSSVKILFKSVNINLFNFVVEECRILVLFLLFNFLL